MELETDIIGMEEKKDFIVRKYFTTWLEIEVSAVDEDDANEQANDYVADHSMELLDNMVENERDCEISEI